MTIADDIAELRWVAEVLKCEGDEPMVIGASRAAALARVLDHIADLDRRLEATTEAMARASEAMEVAESFNRQMHDQLDELKRAAPSPVSCGGHDDSAMSCSSCGACTCTRDFIHNAIHDRERDCPLHGRQEDT